MIAVSGQICEENQQFAAVMLNPPAGVETIPAKQPNFAAQPARTAIKQSGNMPRWKQLSLDASGSRVTRSSSASDVNHTAANGGVLTSTNASQSINAAPQSMMRPSQSGLPGNPIYNGHIVTTAAVARPKVFRHQVSASSVAKSTGDNQQPLSAHLASVDSDDSDSDGPILYRDEATTTASTSGPQRPKANSTIGEGDGRIRDVEDDTDTDSEEVPTTGLAAKIVRKDTLSLRRALDDMPPEESDARREGMRSVRSALERKLSQRPSLVELADKNILREQNSAAIGAQRMAERQRLLLRKLSFRPTIAELQDRQIIA